MTWEINDKEIESVLSLPPARRYEYFIKKIVDWETVWSLGNVEGWVLSRADGGLGAVPVWPHARYAELCASGDWQGTQPQAIDLADWTEKWLPGIAADGRWIAIFPTPAGNGVIVKSDRLQADIECELLQYGE